MDGVETRSNLVHLASRGKLTVVAAVCALALAACGGADEAAPAAEDEQDGGEELATGEVEEEEADDSPESDEFDDWLQAAQLGPYAPDEEDWDAVHAAALDEPPLVVYGSTSRVDSFVEAFLDRWPDLEAETVQVGGPDMIERLNREWDAGLREAGVIDLAGPESYDALPEGAVVGYVPPEVEGELDDDYKDPVLTVAMSLSGWAYNPEISPDGSPFNSLWDLTTEEFRGLVVLTDPTASSSAAEQLVGTVARGDELYADYEDVYGESLDVDPADAGFEWLRRLLDNDPHVVDDWRPAAEILTNNDEPMVAQMNFIRMTSVEDGTYQMELATGISPQDAVSSGRWQGIGSFTESPNTAKLFIREMMSEDSIAQDYYTRGFMSPRAGWAPTEDWMQPMADISFWNPVPEFTRNRGHEVMDLWLTNSPS